MVPLWLGMCEGGPCFNPLEYPSQHHRPGAVPFRARSKRALAAGLLVLADILARTLTVQLSTDSLAGSGNVPTGAVTALLGALFFFYLLLRKST